MLNQLKYHKMNFSWFWHQRVPEGIHRLERMVMVSKINWWTQFCGKKSMINSFYVTWADSAQMTLNYLPWLNIHTYIHLCILLYTHTYKYIHTYIHTYICLYIYIYVCMYVCMYIECMYVYIYVCMWVYMYARMFNTGR